MMICKPSSFFIYLTTMLYWLGKPNTLPSLHGWFILFSVGEIDKMNNYSENLLPRSD